MIKKHNVDPKQRARVGPYIVDGRIGSGSFATVWKAHHAVNGNVVAIKSISREKMNLNKKHRENLDSEIDIMKKLNHSNTVRLYDITTTERHIYLILEYCGGGDLSDYIKNHGPMSETQARAFLKQLARGLLFMRINNLIHRDLKPQNLLLTEDNPDAILKIADFGFARHIQPHGLAATLCGSPLYMAPEILRYEKYDAKADLWSVGTILYEMVTGRPPFNASNHVELLKRIEHTELRFPPDIKISSTLLDLLQKLLKRNPLKRLSFEEFFRHPFVDEAEMLSKSGVSIDHRMSLGKSRRTGYPSSRTLPEVPEGMEGDNRYQSNFNLSPDEAKHSYKESPSSQDSASTSDGSSQLSSSGQKHSPQPRFSRDLSPRNAARKSSPQNALSRGDSPRTWSHPRYASQRDINSQTSQKNQDNFHLEPSSGSGNHQRTPCLNVQAQSRHHRKLPRRGSGGTSGKTNLHPGVINSANAMSAPRASQPYRQIQFSGSGKNSVEQKPSCVNGSDDFVVITNSGSASGAVEETKIESDLTPSPEQTSSHQSQSTPSFESQFASDQQALETFRHEAKRAIQISALADQKLNSDDLAGALGLYNKGLSLLLIITKNVAAYVSVERSRSTSSIQTFEGIRNLLPFLIQRFDYYIKKAKSLRTMIDPQSDATCPEKLIYDAALQLAREAAVDEMMNKYQDACYKYRRAYRYLKQLYVDKANSVDEHDSRILERYMKEFFSRIKDLMEKLNKS